MSYVIIHGGGLAGTRLAGAGLAGAGLQRGMRDGLGPHLVDTRGGLFRDFATQGVGGLGSAESLDAVQAGLDKLVTATQEQTAAVVDSVGLLSRGAAREWAGSIAGLAQHLRQTLSATGSTGVPLYKRAPEAAARLVSSTAKDIDEMAKDFAATANATVAANLPAVLHQIFRGILDAVIAAADEAVRAAVDAAAKLPPIAGLPGWIPVLGGILALVVVAKAFR